MADSEPWGDVGHYRTRKERNRDEIMNRCLGGIRTHSFEEKVAPEKYAELEFTES